MTGSEPVEGNESKQRFPWQLIVAALAWASLGLTAVIVALGGTASKSEADSSSVSQVQSNLGDSAATVGERGGANAAILILIGLATLLLTGLLMLGQGWTRMALQAVGLVSVLYFAFTVGWVPTIVAMLALVVGSVMLLSAGATRYLAG